MKILGTERLFLSHIEVADAPFILELLNCPSWLKYIGNKGVNDLSSAKLYIKSNMMRSYQAHGFGMYKITEIDSGTEIGLCGLLQRNFLEYPDIGFALLPAFEGLGFGFEAASAVLQYAQEQLALTDLCAITSEDNYRSHKLLEKLGFRAQGMIDNSRGEAFKWYRWPDPGN